MEQAVPVVPEQYLLVQLMEELEDYPSNYLHHTEIFQGLDIQVLQEHTGLLEVDLDLTAEVFKVAELVEKGHLHYLPKLIVVVVVGEGEHSLVAEELVAPEL